MQCLGQMINSFGTWGRALVLDEVPHLDTPRVLPDPELSGKWNFSMSVLALNADVALSLTVLLQGPPLKSWMQQLLQLWMLLVHICKELQVGADSSIVLALPH